MESEHLTFADFCRIYHEIRGCSGSISSSILRWSLSVWAWHSLSECRLASSALRANGHQNHFVYHQYPAGGTELGHARGAHVMDGTRDDNGHGGTLPVFPESIARNTYVGLKQVDPSYLESGKGIGMSPSKCS